MASASPSPTRFHLLALLTAVAVIAGLMSAVPAQADTAPADPSTPVTAAADALPTVQINGVVWSQAIVGNTVYVGGEFTTARPAGAAEGVSTVPRANLLAYNLTTGELISSWNPGANAKVAMVAASPDGSRVYVGGNFTSIAGQPRYRIAAFDTATGALVAPWSPGTNARVTSLAVSGTTVYVSGVFTNAGNQTRNGLAAFNTTTGAVLPWTGNPQGGRVEALTVKSDGSQVVVGGSFTSLNGSTNPGYGLASLDGTTGSMLPWAANNKVRNGTSWGAILSLVSNESGVYGTGYTSARSGGSLEGTFKASWAGGTLEWVEDCHGDTYSAVPLGDVVYTAGHAHYCGNTPGGFPQTNPWSFYRAIAFTDFPTGEAKRDPYGYYNWQGTPAPTLLNWYPDINVGTYTGQSQGPWNIAANDQYLAYGGEFTVVNNKKQQGLVRFAVKDIAPNQQGPRVSAADFTPTGTSFASGTLRLNWTANYDRDNEYLTYRVFRDGNMATPIAEFVGASKVWNRPQMSYLDTGLTPGQSHTYRLRAIDPFGNQATGDWVTLTSSGSGELSDYAARVLDDNAAYYWPLGESSGTKVFDWAGGNDATARSGVSRNVTGAIAGTSGKASRFNGSTSGFAYASVLQQAPNNFTVEAWFKTTGSQGGKIVGFGDGTTALSSQYDRHVYMDSAGRLWFGVYPGSVQTVNTTSSYNNGQWHHVAATLGSGGMALYVDGVLAAQRSDVTSGQDYAGYWHIGGDNLASWPNRPNRNYIAADIDEVAVYQGALSAGVIANHFSLGSSGVAVNVPPTAAFNATVDDLSVAVDAAASSDSDGTITGYAWNFGDGGTATGVTANHAYAAAGTYTVSLTVTDDDGAVNTTTRQVTITEPAPNVLPTAAFTHTETPLKTSVDAAGSTDTDGTITGYAWDFGDGGTADGITASHDYAAAGTYEVTLTVTDDDGGTGVLTQDVTVVEPDPNTPLATDAFERSVAAGLGLADSGGPWTVTGSTANYSVAGGMARITAPVAGATVNAYLPGVSSSDTEVQASVAPEQASTGGGVSLSVIGRRVGSDDYRARIKIPASGQVQLQLLHGGGTTLRAANIAGLIYSQGDRLSVRVQVFGTSPTTIQAKVWKVGTTEPADWQLSTTDATAAMQQAGGIGLAVQLSGTATVTPLTALFDDLWAGATTTGAPAEVDPPPAEPPADDPGEPPAPDPEPAPEPEPEPEVPPAPDPETPGDPAIFAQDTFERTVTNGLGASDLGGEWTASGPSFGVGNGAGALTSLVPGSTVMAYLNSVSSSDTDAQVTLALQQEVTGTAAYAWLMGRVVGSDDYRATVKIRVGGVVQLQLKRGDTTLRALNITGLDYATGERLQLHVQVFGTSPTTIRANVWPTGTQEPADWQASVTDDSAALQAPGGLGLAFYLSSAATIAPVAVHFDDLVAKPTA